MITYTQIKLNFFYVNTSSAQYDGGGLFKQTWHDFLNEIMRFIESILFVIPVMLARVTVIVVY